MAGAVNVSLEGIGGLITGIGSAAKDIRAAITGKSVIDPAAQAELEKKVLELENKAQEIQNSVAIAQANIAMEEAKSTKLFIAGARPAILWICGIVVLYTYIVSPILKACGVPVPDMAMSDLWPVVTGMLGLGTMRTYEKSKGVVGTH
jgi:hypothetical protein